MPTTHEQHMHQDEWLASLRVAEAQGYGGDALYWEPRCVLGRAVAIMEQEDERLRAENVRELLTMFGLEPWELALIDPPRRLVNYGEIAQWLGISLALAHKLYQLNDGCLVTCSDPLTDHVWCEPTEGSSLSFSELADWFKVQRDAFGGDLSEWMFER